MKLKFAYLGIEGEAMNSIPMIQIIRCEMLAACRHQKAAASVSEAAAFKGVTLDASHESNCVLARDQGVLSGGLLAAAPPRIPENVDVRRPHSHACGLPCIVYCSSLFSSCLRITSLIIIKS